MTKYMYRANPCKLCFQISFSAITLRQKEIYCENLRCYGENSNNYKVRRLHERGQCNSIYHCTRPIHSGILGILWFLDPIAKLENYKNALEKLLQLLQCERCGAPSASTDAPLHACNKRVATGTILIHWLLAVEFMHRSGQCTLESGNNSRNCRSKKYKSSSHYLGCPITHSGSQKCQISLPKRHIDGEWRLFSGAVTASTTLRSMSDFDSCPWRRSVLFHGMELHHPALLNGDEVSSVKLLVLRSPSAYCWWTSYTYITPKDPDNCEELHTHRKTRNFYDSLRALYIMWCSLAENSQKELVQHCCLRYPWLLAEVFATGVHCLDTSLDRY